MTTPFTIASAEVIPVRIPFHYEGSGVGLMPNQWTHLDTALLRLETSDGAVGWGEAFAYFQLETVTTALREMLLPHILDTSIDSVESVNRTLQQRLHLHGRYGITQFAISAVDMALWDIQAKREGVSVATLINPAARKTVPAYASLLRYGDPQLVNKITSQAVSEGYTTIKLHEITEDAIRAGRAAAPSPIKLITDVNCNWSTTVAESLMPIMKSLDLFWVEEPLFPPDDERALKQLQTTFGVSIASGENACTSVEFARLMPAIDFCQPSVTKVGGITEMLRVCDLACDQKKKVMPHSPYFGPGYHATLQVMMAREECELFECLYVKVDDLLDPETPLPTNGQVAIPDAVGLGFSPDMNLIERYRV